MKKKEPRKREEADRQQTMETRSKILSAATKLFLSKDYHTTTTQEVAKLAGVSKGTVFNHFKTKDELVYETLIFVIDKEMAPLFETIPTLPPEIAIRELVNWTFEVSKDTSGVMWLMLQLAVEGIQKEPSEISKRLNEKLIGLLEESINQAAPLFESLGFPDPRSASQLFFALLDGIGGHLFIFKDTRTDEEIERVKDLIIQLFTKGGKFNE